MDNAILVVVPCGRSKIWSQVPAHGPLPTKDAYVGAPFKVNRAFAERLGNSWIVLSAKYGFIWPEELIPEPYEVTFKDSTTGPIATSALCQQVHDLGLGQFATVIGLGGKEYRAALLAAFTGTSVRLAFPFAGLAIGRAMQATKAARIANSVSLGDAVHRPADAG